MQAKEILTRRLAGVAIVAAMIAGCSTSSASPGVSATASGSPSSSISPGLQPSTTPTTTPTATPPPGGPDKLTVTPFATGLSDPTGATNAGDGSNRLFVVQRGGQVRVVDATGTLRPAAFVDLSSRVLAGGERGLLGLAFHPDFAANGRLFVDYTRAGDGATVVSELTASADRSSANSAGERILLTIAQPFANHNGGQLAFGPDGYLYIGMGDGGSGGDPQSNGQNRNVLLGKILRIDVDGAHAAGKQYAIPSDNPYAPGGIAPGTGLPEVWAYGFRNPWRFSFDRETGDLYIGDVGQNTWEEVDRQPADSGGGENYGWNAFEATHCFAACEGVVAVPPVAEYSHDGRCSVSGGYVYRGAREAALRGTYVFADYCAGTIFTIPAGEGGLRTPKPVASTGLQISSFGEGEDGELYVVDLGGGGIYRVVIGS